MSALRPVLAVALCAGLAAATGVATAAPKPVCKLVTDPTGDGIGSAAVDLTSADVASNGKLLTGVIRVAKAATSEPTSPTGVAWGLRYTAPGDELPYYLLASKFATGETEFTYGQVDGTSLNELGTATGVVDTTANEIRIHVPLKALGLKPGKELTNLSAQARRATGTSGLALYSNADSTTAENAKSYRVGTPSCVKVGK